MTPQLVDRWGVAATRRALAIAMAALVVTGLSACSDSNPPELDQAAASRAREQNQAVLDELPDLAGRAFKAYHEVGPPPGGEGLIASVMYATPPSMTPPQIVDFFEQAMPDWQRICRQDRRDAARSDISWDFHTGRTPAA